MKEYRLLERGLINYGVKYEQHGLDVKCHGYALMDSVTIAEWDYWALDETEATEKMTDDYLLRELKSQVKTRLKIMKLRLAQLEA